MPIALITVGVPGSGKTTWLNRHRNDLLAGVEIFSADDIRLELSGDASDQTLNELVWSTLYDEAAAALKAGKSVAIDATNARQDDRRNLIQHCLAAGATQVDAVWFKTSLRLCLIRNARRDRRVSEGAIERMFKALVASPPSKDDGITDLLVVIP